MASSNAVTLFVRTVIGVVTFGEIISSGSNGGHLASAIRLVVAIVAIVAIVGVACWPVGPRR
jgi:hypothetical protein